MRVAYTILFICIPHLTPNGQISLQASIVKVGNSTCFSEAVCWGGGCQPFSVNIEMTKHHCADVLDELAHRASRGSWWCVLLDKYKLLLSCRDRKKRKDL